MKRHSSLASQRGLTMLMVLMLMTAMLMGALAFARVTEVGSLVTNNIATKDSSYHAAEVGRAEAFAALQALPSKDNNSGGWYWATTQATIPATNLPALINFDAAGSVAGNVGRFTVRYAVERLCTVNAVKDSASECLVLQKLPNDKGDAPDKGWDAEDRLELHPRQYRITVRVTDTDAARGTQTWTQTLVTAPN